MLLLTWIRKLYKVLSADASPSAIAFAIAFGLTVGLLPLSSGLAILLILSILVIRIQLSSALAAFGIAKLLYHVGVEVFTYRVGETLLEAEGLRGFWTWACNFPVLAWLDLNWPLVVGGAAVGIVLGAILVWPVRQLVIGYRRFVHDRVSQNRFFRWLTGFWLTKVLRFIFIGSKVTR